MTRLATHVVLSTAHLSKEVGALLLEVEPDAKLHDWRDHLNMAQYTYGHWIRVPRQDPTDPDDTLDSVLGILPQCISACFEHAARHGAAWILFDRDEPPIDDLPQHDW